jgi:EVE domain
MQGVREGIAQASHGKQTALRRMTKNDEIVYYSPKMFYGQNEKCQRFTAIGKIKDNDIFQVKLNETFSPLLDNKFMSI